MLIWPKRDKFEELYRIILKIWDNADYWKYLFSFIYIDKKYEEVLKRCGSGRKNTLTMNIKMTYCSIVYKLAQIIRRNEMGVLMDKVKSK